MVMLKAWKEDAPLVLGPTLQRSPDRGQGAREACKAAQDAAGQADRRLGAAPPCRQAHPSGGKQHERAIADQQAANQRLEHGQADPRQHPGADGYADQAGNQHRGEPAPVDGMPDGRQHRDVADDGSRRDKLGRDQRLDGLQPERQRGEPGTEACEAIDEAANQRPGQDKGQRAPIPVK
jgi:hypothetical protein